MTVDRSGDNKAFSSPETPQSGRKSVADGASPVENSAKLHNSANCAYERLNAHETVLLQAFSVRPHDEKQGIREFIFGHLKSSEEL